jgi:hypothetical protein
MMRTKEEEGMEKNKKEEGEGKKRNRKKIENRVCWAEISQSLLGQPRTSLFEPNLGPTRVGSAHIIGLGPTQYIFII